MRDKHYQLEKELTNQVLDSYKGRWDQVLPQILPELATAVAKGHRVHSDCVLDQHESETGGTSRTKKMRVTVSFADTASIMCTCTKSQHVSGALNVIMAVRGCDFKTARQMLLDYAGIRTSQDRASYTPPPPRPEHKPDPEVERKHLEAVERTKSRITKIWGETLSLDHPEARAARLWMKRRGIWPPIGTAGPLDLRFHRSLGFYSGEDEQGRPRHVGDFPTLVGMIRGVDGRTCGINRTYMTEDGRKPPGFEDDCRKMYTPDIPLITRGAAVKFDEPKNGILNVAEGIETALAVRMLHGLPQWATLTANNLESLEIPDDVQIVTVWADKDRSNTGQRAADALVTRLRSEGRQAVALLPPDEIGDGQKTVDWNDMVQRWGVATVRQNLVYQSWYKRLLQKISEMQSADKGPSSSVVIK